MPVTVAKSAGYCFGVERAVAIAMRAGSGSQAVYTLGPVIHNRHVTQMLETKGVFIADGVENIPNGAAVVIRAHGVPAAAYERLKEKNVRVIDATCPFVAKIHKIVRRESETGRTVLIIGKKNHPEVVGIEGWCRNAFVCESAEEAEALLSAMPELRQERLCVVAQTTINRKIWNNCVKFIKTTCTDTLFFDTICNATTERQEEAGLLAAQSDVVVVIGDEQSSNTKRLFELCSALCKRTYLVSSGRELGTLGLSSNDRIAITAGASTPAWIIKEVRQTMSEELKIETESGESFAELLEQSLKTLNTGDKVTGVITRVTPTEIYVDLGVKQAAFIPASELSDDPTYKAEENLKEGDEIDAYVMRVNDMEGTVMLSKKRLDTVKGWENIELAKEEKTPVEGFVTEENKGGIVVSVGGVRVFVPASQTGLGKDVPMSTLLKQKVKLRITEVNRGRRRVVGSIRAIQMEERHALAEKVWATIDVGQQYKGTVKSLTDYGAFVDIGGVDGMVHISELSWNRVKHPSEVVKVGDVIDVHVIGLDREKKKISLGHKTEDTNPWKIFIDKYQVGDVANVKILKFMPFGAFAELIPGVDGLIHISQIADHRIAKPDDELKIGQMVDVKIIDINYETKKISLSIRALDEPEAPVEDGEEE